MRSAVIAWLKSLPGALLVPVGIWLLFGLVVIGSESYSTPLGGLGFGLYGGMIGLLFHAGSYLLFGLPVFLMYYSRPDAAIWKPGWSMTAGVVLGALPFIITGQVMPAPIGMAYGAWTTLFAWRQRPRRRNHAVETTPLRSLPHLERSAKDEDWL